MSLPKPRFPFQVSNRLASLIVEVEQLEVGYDEQLFPPFSFILKREEKVAITGHNGIGKSTTLKTLMGELKPLGGKILYQKHLKIRRNRCGRFP